MRAVRGAGVRAAALLLAAVLAPLVAAAEPVMPVSMIQLIADPARHHGRTVRVIAFLRVEFEGTALCLHEEDWKRGIHANGIWLSLAESQVKPAARLGNGYVIAEGRFDARDQGHLGMWSGALENVTRLDPWSR